MGILSCLDLEEKSETLYQCFINSTLDKITSYRLYGTLYTILYWSDKSVQYRNDHDRNSGTFKMAEKYGRHYIKLCFLIFCSIDNVILTSFGLEVEDRFYPRSISTLGTIGGLTVRGFRLVISSRCFMYHVLAAWGIFYMFQKVYYPKHTKG